MYPEREWDKDKRGERKWTCVFGEFLCAKNNIWNVFCLWWQQKQQETCETKPWLDVIWIYRREENASPPMQQPCILHMHKHFHDISASEHLFKMKSIDFLLLKHIFFAEKWHILTKSGFSEMFTSVLVYLQEQTFWEYQEIVKRLDNAPSILIIRWIFPEAIFFIQSLRLTFNYLWRIFAEVSWERSASKTILSMETFTLQIIFWFQSCLRVADLTACGPQRRL